MIEQFDRRHLMSADYARFAHRIFFLSPITVWLYNLVAYLLIVSGL